MFLLTKYKNKLSLEERVPPKADMRRIRAVPKANFCICGGINLIKRRLRILFSIDNERILNRLFQFFVSEKNDGGERVSEGDNEMQGFIPHLVIKVPSVLKEQRDCNQQQGCSSSKKHPQSPDCSQTIILVSVILSDCERAINKRREKSTVLCLKEERLFFKRRVNVFVF